MNVNLVDLIKYGMEKNAFAPKDSSILTGNAKLADRTLFITERLAYANQDFSEIEKVVINAKKLAKNVVEEKVISVLPVKMTLC